MEKGTGRRCPPGSQRETVSGMSRCLSCLVYYFLHAASQDGAVHEGAPLFHCSCALRSIVVSRVRWARISRSVAEPAMRESGVHACGRTCAWGGPAAGMSFSNSALVTLTYPAPETGVQLNSSTSGAGPRSCRTVSLVSNRGEMVDLMSDASLLSSRLFLGGLVTSPRSVHGSIRANTAWNGPRRARCCTALCVARSRQPTFSFFCGRAGVPSGPSSRQARRGGGRGPLSSAFGSTIGQSPRPFRSQGVDDREPIFELPEAQVGQLRLDRLYCNCSTFGATTSFGSNPCEAR